MEKPLKPEQVRFYHVRVSFVVDLFKGVTTLAIIYFIARYNAWSNPNAWIYLGLHGSYGILWVAKSLVGFRDWRFHVYLPVPSTLITCLAMIFYWGPIWTIVGQSEEHRAPLWVMALCIGMYACGVFWHFAADIHKAAFLDGNKTLKSVIGEEEFKKRKLPNVLQTKLWSICRNPNYFGELLIYGSFCLASWSLGPWIWLGVMMAINWFPGMFAKEKSLSRFGNEYKDYKSKTWFFIPLVW